MSDPFIAEIRIFPFNFAPQDWYACDGQTLSIASNTALFSLIGTFYGGNGTTNFQLPNLQNAAPLNFGTRIVDGVTYNVGDSGGEQSVTLTYDQLATHTHAPAAATPGTYADPGGAIFGEPATERPTPNFYASALNAPAIMNPSSIGYTGSSQSHNNMMPYLALNYCIAIVGIFPTRA
jgi:microcystin-dependent protein